MEIEERNNTHGKPAITFHGLTVWCPEERTWWRRKPVKPKTVILNHVSGCVKEGEFIAVIGPSGAGKTTFLVSLAGRCSLPSEGSVTVDGVDVRQLQGAVEVAPQNEVFMEELTVSEHLVFMTEMKLGSCRNPKNRATLSELSRALKLDALAHTAIGSLSGGERRLLSLAFSLISSPKILICDEPTTGLDSYNAALIIGVLKTLASSGRVVLCSVHQPSSALFEEFTSVMLMSEGRLLFHGTQEECMEVFQRMNLNCPKNYNPAEFYIKSVSSATFNDNYSKNVMENPRERSGTHECDITGSHGARQFNLFRRSWCMQVYLLLWRTSLTVTRDIRKQLLQLIISVAMSSIVIATCYIGVTGSTQRGVQDMSGFLWLVCSEVAFSLSYNALYAFEEDLALFKREHGMYSASAYFVAKFCSLLPRCLIFPLAYVAVAAMAVELPNYLMTALEFILALTVASVAATAYGLGMGALFTSTGAMGDVMPCTDLPLFLMSGTFLRISSLPYWLQSLKYISHFYYGMDAMSNIYWRQIGSIDCPPNSAVTCIKDGSSVLIANGYSNNFILLDTLGLTFVTLLWSLLAYWGLKREERKGYAY